MTLQRLQFILFCVRKMILYQIVQIGQNFKKTVSFDDIVHFIDEENFLTYVDFDCGITFYPETSTKIRHIKRGRKYIFISCERPKYNLSDDQHNCSIDEKRTSNIFLNPYILWDMIPAALILIKLTNDRDSMSNNYPQPTTHQPRTDSTPVLSSCRTLERRKKILPVSFAFFQTNCIPDRRVNETVPTVEESNDLWKPGAMGRIPPFVMSCICI